MKKGIWLLLVLACLLSLAGCAGKSMNDIIANEPSITGTVTEVAPASILLQSEGRAYWVSLQVQNKDSVTELTVGDEVTVYYDGSIAETYPMQINTVYAIVLKTPADRSVNDRS